jgi:addiction module RelB/DinJ family antitoxin
MSSTVLNIRLDEQTKEEISSFAKSVGLTASAFATAVLKQAVHEQRVVLRPILKPTEALESTLREVDSDIKEGKNISKRFTSAEDMFKDLDS